MEQILSRLRAIYRDVARLGKGVPVMSEILDLHRPFAKWLREQGIEFINPRSDKESTVESGLPDFTILSPTGCIFIEMKTDKGSLSVAQKAVHERLKSKGFLVFVVRDLATAIELVTAWREFGPEMGEAQQATKELGIHIRNVPGRGDWIFSGDKPIRRATIADLATIERRNA